MEISTTFWATLYCINTDALFTAPDRRPDPTRRDKTVESCPVDVGGVNLIHDDFRVLSPTENLKTKHVKVSVCTHQYVNQQVFACVRMTWHFGNITRSLLLVNLGLPVTSALKLQEETACQTYYPSSVFQLLALLCIILVFCLQVTAHCHAIRSFSGLLTLVCGNFIFDGFLVSYYVLAIIVLWTTV